MLQRTYLWAHPLVIILQGERLLRTRGQDVGHRVTPLPVGHGGFCPIAPRCSSWEKGEAPG